MLKCIWTSILISRNKNVKKSREMISRRWRGGEGRKGRTFSSCTEFSHGYVLVTRRGILRSTSAHVAATTKTVSLLSEIRRRTREREREREKEKSYIKDKRNSLADAYNCPRKAPLATRQINPQFINFQFPQRATMTDDKRQLSARFRCTGWQRARKRGNEKHGVWWRRGWEKIVVKENRVRFDISVRYLAVPRHCTCLPFSDLLSANRVWISSRLSSPQGDGNSWSSR